MSFGPLILVLSIKKFISIVVNKEGCLLIMIFTESAPRICPGKGGKSCQNPIKGDVNNFHFYFVNKYFRSPQFYLNNKKVSGSE